MRFIQTIRFDNSDLHAYPEAARPGEWAVSGTFHFADMPEESLTGKTRQAFANGFLGARSFGWSTFVHVAPIKRDEFDAVVESIAARFIDGYGAPDRPAAIAQARREAEFAASLSDRDLNTVLAVQREIGEEGIVERFRVVRPQSAELHAKIWEVVED